MSKKIYVVYACIGVGLGMLLASLPQFIINYREFKILSPMVITDGLFTHQLLWGLKLQRYDTTISEVLGTPRLCFADRAGFAIVQAEGIQDSITIKKYLSLFVKYPFEMVGMYFRHFVNMLLPVYPENFVWDIGKKKTLTCICLLISTGILGIGICAKAFTKTGIMNFISVFIPIMFIIPGSVEQRYGMGLYMFMIGSICFSTNWKKLEMFFKQNMLKCIVGTVLFGGLMISIWTSTLASIEIEYPTNIELDYPIFIE